MSTQLQQLHQTCLQLADQDLHLRLHTLCEFFLGKPYGFWKDGSNINSLDDFNYNLDLLDCVLYVEVILALAKTPPLTDYNSFVENFESLLRRIHYAKGVPSFMYRNHFFCVDWIYNNRFLVTDITHSLWNNIKTATTTINKLAWLKKHTIATAASEAAMEEAKDIFVPQTSVVPYIDTEDLLNNKEHFCKMFPKACVVNIVRPNWDITERIGTHLNISHLGFAFNLEDNKNIEFYHATIIKMAAVKDTLFNYMQQHRDSPTIRGFNVLAIAPGYDHAGK